MGFKDTTLALPPELKEELRALKIIPKETFPGVLRRIIDQAERVPSLEKEISSLEDKLLESANEIGNLRMQVKELEDENREFKEVFKHVDKNLDNWIKNTDSIIKNNKLK